MGRDLQAVGDKLPDLYGRAPERLKLPPPPPLRTEIKTPVRIGGVIVALFFAVGGGWAATAPLSGAVIAGGMVSPESSRQTVQHLEGGIIREILVREGDEVKAGQSLVVLQDIGPQANVGAKLTQLRALAAKEARLRTERFGVQSITFDHPTLADRTDPDVRLAIEQEERQLITRRANDDTQVSILEQRIAQLDKQIEGAQQQLVGVRRQRALIREELVAVRELFEKGYERKPRMLELQREEAGLTGNEGELVSRVARAHEAIGETKAQIINISVERLEEVDKELTETQTQRIAIEKEVTEGLDRLRRTAIVAPKDGVVLNVRFKTEGGVVRPGEAVLDIVPADDDLIIDARVSPNDIDDVHPGLAGYVIFPSYSQRTMLRIPAQVRHVSADSLRDEKTGDFYFQVKVEVDRALLKEMAPQIQLTPGLPAEAFIATSERTVLEYLLQPLMQVIEHSFREH